MNTPNYFDVFGLPTQFDLVEDQLTQNYKTLILQYHPDKVATKSDFEKKQAMMMAATINDAFQTLKHPLNRASFLLGLQGLDADSQTDTHFSNEFLMQQMQWREDLDDFVSSNQQESLKQMYTEIEAVYQQTIEQISQDFIQSNFMAILTLVRQGRFLDKLLTQIKEQIQTQ